MEKFKVTEEKPEKSISFSNIECLNESMLSNDTFEGVSEGLQEIEDLQEFRNKLQGTQFAGFHTVIEEVSLIRRLPLSDEEREDRIQYVVNVFEKKSASFSPRVADLYLSMLSKIKGESYEPSYAMTLEKFKELEQGGDLDLLFSPNVSWDLKLNRVEKRLANYLSGARALDKREGNKMDDDVRKWREGELEKLSENPPEKSDESKPGVDPMERLKDGEQAPSLWSINPAYGGYFKEQSFSEWNSEKNTWTEKKVSYDDISFIPLCSDENPKTGELNITIRASIFAEKWISVPIPYTHGLHKVESDDGECVVKTDHNGDVVVMVKGSGKANLTLTLAPQFNKKFTTKLEKVKVPNMPSKFSEETNDILKKIKKDKRGNIERAEAISSYVQRRIKYLAPKDRAEGDYYNNFYNTHKNGFAGAVDEIKEADCDVANTYFAALCASIDIPVRHCVGHSVKGKDEKGSSHINSGTGHGWSEVWNEITQEWKRVDATPPGDSQLEEDEEEKDGEYTPGDYGVEVVAPTDEELEELREKLSQLKEELSYTREEREIAESAGIELKEARKIVEEIHKAEMTTLPNGERVTDVLSQLFNNIVESLKNTSVDYDGPVRRREGGEVIQDIVRHKIGVLSGENDPTSREKPTEDIEHKKKFSGLDLYVIGDKSGSMNRTDKGESLWKIQRRAEYLIFSALHRFERNLERAQLQGDNVRSVRTQGISFRGETMREIDFDKELSKSFSAADKVNLWNSLTGAGGGNGDSKALSVIYEQIKDEVSKINESEKKDDRVRVVIACSDGGYVNDESQMRALSEALHDLNTLVVGVGLTDAALQVPVVMENPPFSRGDFVEDISDLPVVIAKYVILEAVKLFPSHMHKGTEQTVLTILKKFDYKK